MLYWTHTFHALTASNQAWSTRLAIVNMSHRKRVRTLESCFVPNQSQSESEKNDTEEEQCINQEETDEDRRKPKKITRSHVVVLWKGLRRCSAIFVRNLRRQTSLHQQKGVQISVPLKIKMSPKILAKGTNCPPVIKSWLKPCLRTSKWVPEDFMLYLFSPSALKLSYLAIGCCPEKGLSCIA